MPRGRDQTRRREQAAQGWPWRRILVPIDFSKASLRALDVAGSLARDHGARLFLLSAIEPAVFIAGMESVAMAVPDAVIARDAKDRLVRIARGRVLGTLRVTVMVDRGRAADVITRVAEEKHIDLIVLTTHGRTGLDRFLMGGTAEHVVRHARCPVWVVRDGRRAERRL